MTTVRTWSPQQAAALDAVARWYGSGLGRKQVFRVFGYAGTGKTTLARHFADGLRGRVHYMAYTGKAAMVMRKNGCHGALTIHATIYSVDFNPETGVKKFVLKDVDDLSDAALFVIDECSMVDELIGRSHQKAWAHMRFDMIAAARIANPEISLAGLAMMFQRDHTSILNALRHRGLA